MSGAVEFYGFEFSSVSSASPQLNASQRCFKFTIVAVNVLFLVFGCVSCALGAYAVNSEAGILAGASLPNAIIAIGVFIIIMAFIGCAAAFFESRVALSVYFGILLLLCLLSFFLGIGILVEKGQSRELLETGWNQSPVQAKQAIGEAFGCCGFHEYCDQCFCSDGRPPLSSALCGDNQCTNHTLYQCIYQCPSSAQFGSTGPCLNALQSSFDSYYQQAGGASIAFGVLMFVAMIVVCVLMRGIKQKAYLEDVRAQHRRIREAKDNVSGVDLSSIRTGLESGHDATRSQHHTFPSPADDDDDDDDNEDERDTVVEGRSTQPIRALQPPPPKRQPQPPQYQHDDENDDDEDEDLEMDEEEEDPQRRPPPHSTQPPPPSRAAVSHRPPPPVTRAPPPRASRRPPSDDEDAVDDFS